MTYKTPNGMNIAKVPNREVTRRPKVSLSVFFFLDGLVQNCVTFTIMVFKQTAAFYTEQCTSPSLFHNLKVSEGGSNWSLSNYGFICDAVFFHLCACTQSN